MKYNNSFIGTPVETFKQESPCFKVRVYAARYQDTCVNNVYGGTNISLNLFNKSVNVV